MKKVVMMREDHTKLAATNINDFNNVKLNLLLIPQFECGCSE